MKKLSPDTNNWEIKRNKNKYGKYTYKFATILTTDSNATVLDYLHTKYNEINFSAGLEWRRGTGRVQGFWGGRIDARV